MWGLGFGVHGLRFEIRELGFSVWGVGTDQIVSVQNFVEQDVRREREGCMVYLRLRGAGVRVEVRIRERDRQACPEPRRRDL